MQKIRGGVSYCNLVFLRWSTTRMEISCQLLSNIKYSEREAVVKLNKHKRELKAIELSRKKCEEVISYFYNSQYADYWETTPLKKWANEKTGARNAQMGKSKI